MMQVTCLPTPTSQTVWDLHNSIRSLGFYSDILSTGHSLLFIERHPCQPTPNTAIHPVFKAYVTDTSFAIHNLFLRWWGEKSWILSLHGILFCLECCAEIACSLQNKKRKERTRVWSIDTIRCAGVKPLERGFLSQYFPPPHEDESDLQGYSIRLEDKNGHTFW